MVTPLRSIISPSMFVSMAVATDSVSRGKVCSKFEFGLGGVDVQQVGGWKSCGSFLGGPVGAGGPQREGWSVADLVFR